MQDTAGGGTGRARNTATIDEIDILWMTAGLGCDGDTIAMTGATQPSIEDIVTGALPWIPKVKFYNPFLAYENGDEFVRPFRDAAEGKSKRPFILVVEGSIPNENNKTEGYWASFGTDPVTGQPITTCEWIDRLAPNAWAIIAAGTCATYGGIHAMEGNPTGCMGSAGLSRMEMEIEGGDSDRVRSRVSGAAGQHDGDDSLSSLYGERPSADDSARRGAASDVAVRQHGA